MSGCERGPAWPGDGVVFPVSGFDVGVGEGPHPLFLERWAEIEANWRAEFAANPALFNGQMLIHRDTRLLPDGLIVGTAHLTPYATMLWWRKQPDRPLAEHLFPVAIPVTSDGALLAIEMGVHTANSGRIYCAAGSLDASDIADDRVDYPGNMAREVTEEIGFDLADWTPLTGYLGVRVHRAVTIFRVFRLPFDAEEACDRIHAHMESDHEKEIAGPVLIRNADRDGRNYAAFMPPIIDWMFADDSPVRPFLKGE